MPGVVHTDLLAAGIIGEPFAEFNELVQHWVALENWTYSRTFSFNTTSSSSTLVFDGLDTYANITLNGHHLGVAENAFLRWQTLVPPGLLRPGEDANELVVSFTNPQAVGQTAAAAYPIPLREFRANRYSYSGRPFVRKSQTHFGWNWGPGYITQGIYRGVHLSTVASSGGSIDSVVVQQTGEAPDDDGLYNTTAWPPLPRTAPTSIKVTLDVEVRCAATTVESVMLVRASLPIGTAKGEVKCPRGSAAGALVSTTLALSVAVAPTAKAAQLSLWYPNGYGEQALHKLEVTLCTTAGACAIPWSKPIGLRTAELVVQKRLS